MPDPSRLPPLRLNVFHTLLRRLWRIVLQWRFRFFQRHRYNQLVIELVISKPMVILPKVFNPKLFRTGEFLARTLNEPLIPPQANVLDMGTGSGIGAIVAAQWASHVDAVDVNPHAVRCARINTLLNEVDDRITVHQGDLFDPVRGHRFDVVIFNPPYFWGTPVDALDKAWRSDDVAERFAAGLSDHLTPEGYALVVLSSDGDPTAFLDAFRRSGFTTSALARRNLLNETLTVYQICPPR